MGKKMLIGCGIAVAVVLACVAFVAVVFGTAMFFTKPVADAGGVFMEALKAEDYAGAYAMATTELDKNVGGLENFQAMFDSKDIHPESWSFSSRNIENNIGTLGGTVTLKNGEEMDLKLNLIKRDGQWQIDGFHFDPK